MARLPKLVGTDPSYQEKVVEVRKIIESGKLYADSSMEELLKRVAEFSVEHPEDELGEFRQHGSYLAKRYAIAREKKDLLDEMLYAVNLEVEALKQMVVDQYENEDTTSIRLESGEMVRVQPEPYAQVQNKDLFRAWCIANGYADSLVLPWQTTNSLTKERLLAGESEPPGVKAHVVSKIVLRRD